MSWDFDLHVDQLKRTRTMVEMDGSQNPTDLVTNSCFGYYECCVGKEAGLFTLEELSPCDTPFLKLKKKTIKFWVAVWLRFSHAYVSGSWIWFPAPAPDSGSLLTLTLWGSGRRLEYLGPCNAHRRHGLSSLLPVWPGLASAIVVTWGSEPEAGDFCLPDCL